MAIEIIVMSSIIEILEIVLSHSPTILHNYRDNIDKMVVTSRYGFCYYHTTLVNLKHMYRHYTREHECNYLQLKTC